MTYYSIYEGIVADRKDPEKRGRIKLKVPQLWDDQIHDYWAEPKSLASSGGKILSVPDKDDKVWVTFEGGDQRYPVWEHGVNMGVDVLEKMYDDAGEPVNVYVASSSGNYLLFDEQAKKVLLSHSAGSQLVLSAENLIASYDSSSSLTIKKAEATLNSAKVMLGQDGAANPVVLGDELVNFCTALLNVLKNFVVTPPNYTTNPATVTALETIENTLLELIKSKAVFVGK